MSGHENNQIQNNIDWSNNIKQYEHNKKSLEWGSNPPPMKMTYKIVREKENIFNPVSQRYYNHEFDVNQKTQEKQNIVNSIAKNYDKVLRNEQTYDLINLKDRLTGLETHPKYPKLEQEKIKKKLESPITNYNVISNITLDKHSYLPPEKRPAVKEIKEKPTGKSQTVNAVNFKDYDVITNKYKVFHEDKTKADYELSKLHAAKNYWKSRDYDAIQGRYLDEKKEEEFLNKRTEELINWPKNERQSENK